MGDVTHIYNASGVTVGTYTYTAWGACTIGTNTNSIASKNPFRYRGYYWDNETSLYYLQSRYYDPNVGRFINADDISYLDPESINGLNLYAYCGNNPVMNVDPSGRFFLLIAACLVATLATATMVWEIGKGYTNQDLGGGQFSTTVTWFGLEINTFHYEAVDYGNGQLGVQFDYRKNPGYNVGSWFYSDAIAAGMMDNIKNSEYAAHLQGRSIGGIQLELISHHIGSWFPENSETYKRGIIADIGTVPGADANDVIMEIWGGLLNVWRWLWVVNGFKWVCL